MHDLAAPLSRFVGRSAELAELHEVLREHRLVTLTGIGGIGKTRLALEVAAGWREAVDEVLVVDFASLHTGDLVDGALLEAAGIGPQSGRDALDATVDHLAQGSALVVLDTCEHVLSSTARAAERLLRQCPAVRVLTTSRTARHPGRSGVARAAAPGRSGRCSRLRRDGPIRRMRQARATRPSPR